jgi:hypothetical protein
MKVRYRFKQAETPNEFEQIFRLNHAVFAGELEQHPTQPGARLVDKFHDKNRYVIALVGEEVIGMIAVNREPPFSVAAKLADPIVLNEYGRLLEVRLLAVDPAHRNGVVMAGLMLGVYEHARDFDAMIFLATSKRPRFIMNSASVIWVRQ